MWSGGADEVVAAVDGRTDHEIVRVEQLECSLERRARQMRAVAVERDHASAAAAEKGPEGGREPRREAVAVLRDDLHLEPRREGAHLARRADHGDAGRGQGSHQGDGVLDQAAVERNAREACLHVTDSRGLRHDDEGPGGRRGRHGGRRRYFRMPEKIPHPAPMLPRSVPLIFDVPMRGW